MTRERTATPRRQPSADCEDAFRALFLHHPMPTWVSDARTLAILEVNDAAIRRYGYSREEFLGRTFSDARSAGEQGRPAGSATEGPEGANEIGHERFRDVFESANVGKSITLPNGELAVNEALANLLGYTQAELATMTWQDLTYPEDVEWIQAIITPLLKGERDSARFTKRYLTKSGSFFWADVSTVMRRSEDGKPLYFITTVVDITERRLAEERLRVSERLFSDAFRLGPAGMTITRIADGRFLGVNEYFLKTFEFSRDEVIGHTSTELNVFFSRKQVLQPIVLSLNTVIADMQNMLRRLIGEDIALALVPAEDLGRVRADPGQLEQVLMNLAVNARDAMPKGGTLTIATRNVEFDEADAELHPSVAPGPHVMVSVSDTGGGMDKATQARIFEPFFTTKGPGKGTGLGLSTVYGIVKQSGGSLWVYSEPGKGATFNVSLPRVEGATDTERSVRTATAQGGTETILIVEDEEGLRHLAERALRSAGYRVLMTASGGEALLLLEQHDGPVHLMLTDVVMPGMSGRDLAEQLRGTRPEMKVLYSSGYTDDAILQHGVLDDATSFIGKPYAVADLRCKVREVLDSQR